MKTKLIMTVLLLFVLYGMFTPVLHASQPPFSGKIVFVDPKLHVFIVKAENGEEQAFHPSASSLFTIGPDRKLLGELQKGEEVTVTINAEESR